MRSPLKFLILYRILLRLHILFLIMKIIIIFNVVKLSSVGEWFWYRKRAEKVLILLDILRFLIWIFEWNLIEYFLIKIDFFKWVRKNAEFSRGFEIFREKFRDFFWYENSKKLGKSRVYRTQYRTNFEVDVWIELIPLFGILSICFKM